mmetsp:Transcript_17806/g.44473  ORF Transcript_17806/g.44473 Transcript_17806/m.44473 type:complete len:259 (+) Transcript_17806:951-1727(+)
MLEQRLGLHLLLPHLVVAHDVGVVELGQARRLAHRALLRALGAREPHLLDGVLDAVERVARAKDLAEAPLTQPLALDELLRVARGGERGRGGRGGRLLVLEHLDGLERLDALRVGLALAFCRGRRGRRHHLGGGVRLLQLRRQALRLAPLAQPAARPPAVEEEEGQHDARRPQQGLLARLRGGALLDRLQQLTPARLGERRLGRSDKRRAGRRRHVQPGVPYVLRPLAPRREATGRHQWSEAAGERRTPLAAHQEGPA